jgi:hypothetical protein
MLEADTMSCDIVCSFFAGVVGRITFFPVDTIKTVSSVAVVDPKSINSRQHTIRYTINTILKSDGIIGFYRGLGIAVAASGPGVALYISSYEFSKRWFEDKNNNNNKNSVSASSKFMQHLACGLFAEGVSCIVWVPMDVTKERLQSQHSGVAGRYRSSWHGLQTLYRHEGLRGMYKGYFSTLGSFGPFSAFYFAAFEESQKIVKQNAFMTTNFGTGIQSATAAAMGNIFACIITNPLEVSKTRYQVQQAKLGEDGAVSTQFKESSKSMLDALRTGIKNEGLMKIWTRGLLARIMFQTPSAAMTFGLYDMLKSKICTTTSSSTK